MLNDRNPGCVRIGQLVLSVSVLVLTAGPTVRTERLPIKIYTAADALAHNNVNRIVKDSRGFLWFCTAGGLSRFDGEAFANFGTDEGLPHAYVNDLLETRRGEYWVATNAGLVRFDPKGTPSNRMSNEPEATTRDPMFAVVVPAVEDPRAKAVNVLLEGRDGTIWAGTHNGLYRLDGAKERRSLQRVEIGIPKENAEQGLIQDLLEDARGSLWIAAPSGLYRRSADGSAARYTRRDGLPHDWIQDLLEDEEGQLWAGTRLNGFFPFSADGTHQAPVVDLHFTYPELLASWVYQLFETSDRRFWVATGRGLAEFFPTGDEQGRRFHLYTGRNGLSYHDITALNEDVGGNLWLGTNGVGAMKLALDGFSTFGEQDGVLTVNAIFEDRAGDVCFRGAVLGDARTSVFEGGTLDLLRADPVSYHSRLGCFDGQRFHWFTPAAVTSFGWVQEQVTLQARTGEWWVGTGEGLYRFPEADRFAQLRTAEGPPFFGSPGE